MKKIIYQGEILPKGYGLAYPELYRLAYVCYPFPINHIVRIWRNIWLKIRDAKIHKKEIEIIKEIEDARRQLKQDRQDFDRYKTALFETLRSLNLPTKE